MNIVNFACWIIECRIIEGVFFPQYVPKELIEVYRDELIPLADILTPNDFEAR